MQLFPDEYVITQSNDDRIILTSHRVSYNYISLNRSQTQTVMLEHITSCTVEKSANQLSLLLALAGALIVADGVYTNNQFQLYAGAAFTLLMGWRYLVSRRSLILISSPGTTIKIIGDGLSKEQINDFINKVEHAKHQRLMSVAQHGHSQV
ncbi:MAG: hypothetical protein EOO20_16170 [Chryseobacterium sp.]|nr:MAG: hypothetical protein EOO20_16170 [Chryseobacterium sp.]